MRLLLSACLFLFTATVFAEDTVREVKTANPFIALHPESQKPRLLRITKRLKKTCLTVLFHLSTPSLRLSQHRSR